MNQDKPDDGRKYHIGDKVDFTDDSGKVVPGVVHGVSYQTGRYEWVGAQRPDMHKPESPDNLPIPGTGYQELVKGTENERHSFQYIMVPAHEHKNWWDIENRNQSKIAKHKLELEAHFKIPEEKRSVHLPPHPQLEELPQMTQHIRVFEEDN